MSFLFFGIIKRAYLISFFTKSTLCGKRGESGVDNQNQKLNNVMSGSKRHSRLNLGIASLPNSDSFFGSNGNLGVIKNETNHE